MTSGEKYDVLIIGGGLAGLTFALQVKDDGRVIAFVDFIEELNF